MKSQTLIVIAVLILLGMYYFWKKTRYQKPIPDTDTSRPSTTLLPAAPIANDKLVLVSGISDTELRTVVTGFCNMYNKEKFKALPRIIKLTDTTFAIKFPYDIDFETYCFFINYLQFPMELDRSVNTIGWTTTKSTDSWITEKSANKKAMIYMPEIEDEYDNVYLTTEDNIGYKLGFAIGDEKQLLDQPPSLYKSPNIDLAPLDNKEFIDIK
jgi:hypothetical protein